MSWDKILVDGFELVGRIRRGVGAWIIQGYEEVNKKRGVQWEASRSVALATVGQKAYSVLQVGALPVDLKERVLGATGGGVIGRAYRIQPSDVTFSGPPDPWYNYHSRILTQPLTKIYPGSSITFNTPVVNLAVLANKIHADIFAITNVQNQGKGFPQRGFGGNHILDPGTYVLLEIESFDATQTAAAKLDIYEGGLDFYPE